MFANELRNSLAFLGVTKLADLPSVTMRHTSPVSF
jgi:hypothetical protein